MKVERPFIEAMRQATQLVRTRGPMAATRFIQGLLHPKRATPESATVDGDVSVVDVDSVIKPVSETATQPAAQPWTLPTASGQCSRSASLMTRTRMSRDIATIILRIVSACAESPYLTLSSLVRRRRAGRPRRRSPPHLLEGVRRVLDRVVEQRRDQRRLGHADVGEDRGHRERVGDVGVAALAGLGAVHLRGGDVGALEQRQVGLGVAGPDGAEQRLEDRVAGLAAAAHPGQPGAHRRVAAGPGWPSCRRHVLGRRARAGRSAPCGRRPGTPRCAPRSHRPVYASRGQMVSRV